MEDYPGGSREADRNDHANDFFRSDATPSSESLPRHEHAQPSAFPPTREDGVASGMVEAALAKNIGLRPTERLSVTKLVSDRQHAAADVSVPADSPVLPNNENQTAGFDGSDGGGPPTDQVRLSEAEKIVLEAERRGLRTPRDTLVLWSGLGENGPEASKKWAKDNGGITLEMTPGGKYLQDLDLWGVGGKARGLLEGDAMRIWARTSEIAIEQASGQVRSVLGKCNPASIYHTVERTALLCNEKITGLDELFLAPSVGFK